MSYIKQTDTQTAIHLQLPKVSVDDTRFNSCIKNSTLVENDFESSTDEDEEDHPDLLKKSHGTLVENDGKNMLDMLEVLLSLKSAAWARRKVAINSITSATNAKKIHNAEPGKETGSSNKNFTFTRKCCPQKKEIHLNTPENVGSLINTTEATHSFQPQTELTDDVRAVATVANHISYYTSSGREAVKMHSINLYQAILPSSIFKNSEKNYTKK